MAESEDFLSKMTKNEHRKLFSVALFISQLRVLLIKCFKIYKGKKLIIFPVILLLCTYGIFYLFNEIDSKMNKFQNINKIQNEDVDYKSLSDTFPTKFAKTETIFYSSVPGLEVKQMESLSWKYNDLNKQFCKKWEKFTETVSWKYIPYEKINTTFNDDRVSGNILFILLFKNLDLNGPTDYEMIYPFNNEEDSLYTHKSPTSKIKAKPSPNFGIFSPKMHRLYSFIYQMTTILRNLDNSSQENFYCPPFSTLQTSSLYSPEVYFKELVNFLEPNLDNYKSVYFSLIILFGSLMILDSACIERNDKSYEFLKLIGASRLSIFASHSIVNVLLFIYLAILPLSFLFFVNAFDQIPSIGVFITFLEFAILQNFFCLLVSILVPYNKFANILIILVNILENIKLRNIESHTLQMFAFFLPSVSQNMLWQQFINFKGTNFKFSDFFVSSPNFPFFSIMGTVIFLAFISIFYSFLIFYFDNVWPLQQTVPKPFYFLFQKSTWSCFYNSQMYNTIDRHIQQDDKFEKDTTSRVIISIRNLCKGFYTRYRAFAYKNVIQNLNFDIYQNQITVLLGFNGAGKTTLMDIITGIKSFDSGSLHVNGINILKHLSIIRKSIGLCPQENIFYKKLTVFDNLRLAAVLSGIPFSLLEERIELIAKKVGLFEKLNQKSNNLSGGMKRRLCLGCAFMGNTDILIFDEPTSGLDPETRRDLWNVFLELRKVKTILLTTHFMEEADVLGDRIAILNRGSIVCAGSPMFLKKAYKTGYSLKLQTNIHTNCEMVDQLIKNIIPDAYIENAKDEEISYRVCSSELLNSKMEHVFRALEEQNQTLKLLSWGLANTSLEDVFIRAGECIGKDSLALQINSEQTEEDFGKSMIINTEQAGLKLLWQQTCAMVVKRFHYNLANPITMFMQFILSGLLCYFIGSTALNLIQQSIPKPSTLDIDIPKAYDQRNMLIMQLKDYEKSDLNTKISQIAADQYKIQSEILSINANSFDEFRNEMDIQMISRSSNDKFKYMMAYGKYAKTNEDVMLINPFYSFALPTLMNIIGTYNSNERKSEKNDFSLKLNSIHYVVLESLKKDEIEKSSSLALFYTILLFPSVIYFFFNYFADIPMSEKQRKTLLIQKISGLSGRSYWFMNLFYDGLQIIIFVLAMMSMFTFYFEIDFLNIATYFWGIFITLFMISISITVSIYVLPLIFGLKVKNTLIAIIYTDAISLGVFLYFTIQKYVFVNENLIGRRIFYIILPAFNFLEGICDLHFLGLKKFMIEQNIPVEENSQQIILASENLNWHLYMAVIGLILHLALLYIFDESLETMQNILERVWNRICKVFRKSTIPIQRNNLTDLVKHQEADPLVEQEKLLVNQLVTNKETGQKILVVQNLQKQYSDLLAVDKISFTVAQKECFGLLGLNGAGKTTTFSMLTGDLKPTSGLVFLNGKILNDFKDAYQFISYCPQVDCLFENLRVDHTIMYYCQLRGMKVSSIPDYVKRIVNLVDLDEYITSNSETLSGGNKRKLALAISLIGSPLLVYLDEPTTGVDPIARRKIWGTLNMFKKFNDRSFILTSHSMDECEFLCNRIAIMAQGRINCLGNFSQLRDRYALGYVLTLKLDYEQASHSEYTEQVKSRVIQIFLSAQFKDLHLNTMTFFLNDNHLHWSSLFNKSEQLRKEFNLMDYTITSTTLEQVFLSFSDDLC